jgi:hypothetical protein
MNRPTPPPEDDQLLERLRALGPVLDDLAAEAGANAAGTGGSTVPRRPDRRPALAAAAVVLLIAGLIAITVVRSRADGTLHADQGKATTTIESDRSLARRIAGRIDDAERCGPMPTRDQVPVPWPDGWDIVGSPECATAYVEDPADTTAPVPVYLEPRATTPIAYWSAGTGWIDAAEYEDPAFDLERYRAAYQAELDARGGTSGN